MIDNVVVLLSSYNGEKFIEEQIKSIEKQINVCVKIIIRDDGSTDKTLSILNELKSYYNNIVIIEGTNVGCAKSFSELLEYAYSNCVDYTYFAFSDQDDFWLEDKLYNGIAKIKSLNLNSVQILYCSNLWVVDEKLQNAKLKYPKNYVKIDKICSLAESYGTGCTMVFNKTVIDFYNEHKPSRIHLHDLWIYHQVLFLGNVIYDDDSYILYRQHGNNVVGARLGLKNKIQGMLRSLKNPRSQNYRETEAQEIIKTYGSFISKTDYRYVKKVAEYRKSIIGFFRLLFSTSIKRRKFNDTLLFKIRVVFHII